MQTPATMSTSRWITSAELATRTGVHSGTIARWAREGRMPGHRVGRRLRFEHPDVLLFLSDEVPAPGTGQRAATAR